MNLERLARTLVGMGVLGADTALLAPPAILASVVLGPTHWSVDGLLREWAAIALRGCSAELRTNGDAHLDPAARYVFVSNHASHLDSCAILCTLRHHSVRFVAKQELAGIPLFGHALRSTGNVIVERRDTGRDVSTLDEAGEEVDVSVLFFAEGTRHPVGELAPFKRGAAAFALKAGLPLVPVGVYGSREILPPGYEIRRAGAIGVSVGEPIEVKARELSQRGALTDELRCAVTGEIERARHLV